MPFHLDAISSIYNFPVTAYEKTIRSSFKGRYMATLTHASASNFEPLDPGLILSDTSGFAPNKARAFPPHRMYSRYAEAVREGFQSNNRVRLQRSSPVNLEPRVVADVSELHAMKPGHVLSAEFGDSCRIMATYLGHDDFRILVFERRSDSRNGDTKNGDSTQSNLWQMAQVSALSLSGLTRLLQSNSLGAPSTLTILGG